MCADEAAIKSEDGRKLRAQVQAHEIENRINNATKDGYRSTTYDHDIEPEVMDALKALGYKVKVHDGDWGYFTRIEW